MPWEGLPYDAARPHLGLGEVVAIGSSEGARRFSFVQNDGDQRYRYYLEVLVAERWVEGGQGATVLAQQPDDRLVPRLQTSGSRGTPRTSAGAGEASSATTWRTDEPANRSNNPWGPSAPGREPPTARATAGAVLEEGVAQSQASAAQPTSPPTAQEAGGGSETQEARQWSTTNEGDRTASSPTEQQHRAPQWDSRWCAARWDRARSQTTWQDASSSWEEAQYYGSGEHRR